MSSDSGSSGTSRTPVVGRVHSGLAASYALLLISAATWWLALPLAISLGLAMAACGFNIQHDGGHLAFSKRRWVNQLAAMTLDLLGGSSYVWSRKHNVVHHSYSNVTGHGLPIRRSQRKCDTTPARKVACTA